VSQKTFQIGVRDLEAYIHDPPINGVRYSIEASGNQRQKSQQQLHPVQFLDTTFDQLPDALSVSIYEVQTSFQPIDMVYVSKTTKYAVSVLMSFSFSTWEMPESLGKFVERYVKGLHEAANIVEASCDKSEYGFDVFCEASPASSEKIYRIIQELEVTAASVYRETIIPPVATQKKTASEAHWQWWIRYVLVPIVCSGSVAAVLAKYLLQ